MYDIKKRNIFTFAIVLSLLILSVIFVAYFVPVLLKSNFATEDQILLTSIPEANIYLYANKQSAENGLYEELTLYSDDINKRFIWKNTASETWKPVLLLEDLTGDNKKELIVILVYGTGTGVYVEDVHILDADILKEFKIQSTKDIINLNAEIETYENTYEVKIDDKVFLIDKSALDSHPQRLFDAPAFQNHLSFQVKDDRLFATVLLQVSPTEFAGEFVIEYTYQNHRFTMESITFFPTTP
jgi:hypothetical protein